MSRRRRGGSHAPVELQFSVKYAMPKNRSRRMTAAILTEAIEEWIENGEAPDGFEIEPIAWVHAGRATEATDESRFRDVLGRLVRAGTPYHFTIRRNERVERR